METVEVKTGAPYRIEIGRGLLDSLGDKVRALTKAKKAMIVTDETVYALYFERAARSLESVGIEVLEFVIPSGETSKSTGNLIKLWETLAENALTRSDVIVALGGGVVGDLAGFAAATYLRGIKYIQVPTTLLAMTDSSVGGKTAVDLKAGKNLAGAFYQPCAVVCDPDTLATLRRETLSDGMAEVIKYAMINNPVIIDKLFLYTESDSALLDEIIALCIEDKRDIVSRDEFDRGERALLNFGHTPAHAIERLSNYTVTHGSAVAVGMMIISRASAKLGLCNADVPETLEKLLDKFSLPKDTEFGAEDMAKAALGDKKRSGDRIDLILSYGVGDARICPTKIDELCEIFRKGTEK